MSTEEVKLNHRSETMTCAENVRKYLLTISTVKAQIARATGLSDSMVKRIVDDLDPVSMDTLFIVAEHARKPAEHFLYGVTTSQDQVFFEQVAALAKKVPTEMRSEFLDFVMMFLKITNPSKMEEKT